MLIYGPKVAPEHQDGLAKLLQRREKAQRAHRTTRSVDVSRLAARSTSPADLLFAPAQSHRTPTSRSRPLEEDSSPLPPLPAEDHAASSTNQASTTVLSDSASSQDQGKHGSVRSSPMQSQDDSWTDRFTRKSIDKNKSKGPLTEEQYLALERETDGKAIQTFYNMVSPPVIPQRKSPKLKPRLVLEAGKEQESQVTSFVDVMSRFSSL